MEIAKIMDVPISGITSNPAFSLQKFRYFVFISPSIAFDAPSPAGGMRTHGVTAVILSIGLNTFPVKHFDDLSIRLLVGVEVGLLVGFKVGLLTGLEVGLLDGLKVGLLVGLKVGLLVGLKVGILVGFDIELSKCWLIMSR